VSVEAYGARAALKTLGTIAAQPSSTTTLLVTPHDPSTASSIIAALNESDRGVTCAEERGGRLITVKFPPLSKESREAMAKAVRTKAEAFRTRLSRVHNESRAKLKKIESGIGKDEKHRV
jgi:ribosome recycling factor